MITPLILIAVGGLMLIILFAVMFYREIKQMDDGTNLNKLFWFLFLISLLLMGYGAFLILG